MTGGDAAPGPRPRGPARLLPLVFPALALAFFPRAMLGLGSFFHYDTWLQNLTFRAWWFAQLKAGHFATWCPGMFGGYPLFAETQTGPLYPPTFVLFLLLPATLAFAWSVGLHFALAGWGTWRLARRLGAGTAGALAAGVAFELSGFLVAHVVHFNLLVGAAWAPWAVVFALDATDGKPRAAAGLAAVVGLQLLGAHPYATLMTLALVVVALAVRAGARPGAWLAGGATTAGAVLLGAGLAAVQVLPTRAFLPRTTRGESVDWSFLTFGSFPPWHLPTLVAPDLFGSPADATWWGGPDWSHWAETCAWVGAPALALAVAALVLRRDRATRFASLATAGSALLMLGKYTPAYRLLSWLPVAGATRLPARWALPFTLGVALLAGLGLDALLREPRVARRRAAGLAAALVLVALGAAAFVLGAPARDPGVVVATTGRLWSATIRAIEVGAARDSVRLAVALVATLVALLPLVGRSSRPRRAVAAVPVLALLLLDPFSWGTRVNPTLPPAAVTAAPPAVAALPAVAPRPRIFRQGVDELWSRTPGAPRVDLVTPGWDGRADDYATGAWTLPPNTQLLWDVDSGEGFTSLLPRAWLEWMGLPDAPGATPRPDLTEAQADLLAIDAVISTGSGIAGEGWSTTALPGDVWVSRNLDPLPRVRLAQSWRTMPDRAALLASLREPSHDPRVAVLLEASPPGLPGSRSGGPVDRAIPARETGPGAWTIEVPGAGEGLVVLAESYDPDWIVTAADGRRLPTLRADGLFLAFPAPAGGGRVQARHAPGALRTGAFVSLASLLVLAVGVATGGRKGRFRLPALPSIGGAPGPIPGAPGGPLAFVAVAALVVAVSLALDVGGWRADREAASLEAAAVRSWSDEAFAAWRAGAPEAAAVLLRTAVALRPGDATARRRLEAVERSFADPREVRPSDGDPSDR